MGQRQSHGVFAIDLPSDIQAYPYGFSKFASSCGMNGQVVAVPQNADKVLAVNPSTRETFAIDLPSGICARGHSKFVSSCTVNGQVVAVPDNAEKILVVNPSSREAFAIDLPSGICARGHSKFVSSCAVNGQVVAVPQNAEKVLVVNPSSRETFAIDLPSGTHAGGFNKLWSSCAVNGQVVAVPNYAEKVLVVNPSSRETFAIDLPSGICARRYSKFVSSCAVNGQVVAVPDNAEKILVVNPSSRETFAIDLPSGICARGYSKFVSSCPVNGQVVAVPNYAEKVLVVNPSSREAFAIDLPSGTVPLRCNKFVSSCTVNGQVVAVPDYAEKVLVVNPSSREAFAIHLPSGTIPLKCNNLWSSCAVNGQVVAVPDRAQKILVVNPSSREAFAIDLPSDIFALSYNKFASSCAVNGQVVAVPQNAEKILVVEPATAQSPVLRLNLHGHDAHTRPQFAEVVAAVLSHWVYTDEPEPPEVGHATFDVHTVMQPGDHGTAVKIASVTATLPEGKVLYIVFKGTSYILDFLNWNLEHDHDTTGEPDFFAHCGTAGTLRNSRFWKADAFFSRLLAAKVQGVQKVVFSGHSLGGMYAQMSLFFALEELRRGFGRACEILSLFSLHSFTFGAPMVFGGASQKATEFKRFARDHAVNYIHADDPCPRAWGALNLRDFVQKATMAVTRGLQDTYGSILGTVASRVVEEMGAKLLRRPDFCLIEDLARKYDHMVPLKVLSTRKQSIHWQELQLKPEGLADHSVEAYVNKLFDALDTSRPECYIHPQPFST